MHLSTSSSGREVQNCGAPTTYYGRRGNFKRLEGVFEHTERAWHYLAQPAQPHRATYTGRSLRVSYARNGRGRNPESSTTSRRARVSNSYAPNGVSPVWFATAHAAGYRGTGCVHCARPGLWGGRRVTGAFTRKVTACQPSATLRLPGAPDAQRCYDFQGQELVTDSWALSSSSCPACIGRGGARKRRRLIMLLAVDWFPPSLRPSSACLARGTRVSCSLFTPSRVAPHRGRASADGRSKLRENGWWAFHGLALWRPCSLLGHGPQTRPQFPRDGNDHLVGIVPSGAQRSGAFAQA